MFIGRNFLVLLLRLLLLLLLVVSDDLVQLLLQLLPGDVLHGLLLVPRHLLLLAPHHLLQPAHLLAVQVAVTLGLRQLSAKQ